jgi:hypothetical protein
MLCFFRLYNTPILNTTVLAPLFLCEQQPFRNKSLCYNASSLEMGQEDKRLEWMQCQIENYFSRPGWMLCPIGCVKLYRSWMGRSSKDMKTPGKESLMAVPMKRGAKEKWTGQGWVQLGTIVTRTEEHVLVFHLLVRWSRLCQLLCLWASLCLYERRRKCYSPPEPVEKKSSSW